MKVKKSILNQKKLFSLWSSLLLLLFIACDNVPEYVFVDNNLPESDYSFTVDQFKVTFVNNSQHATVYMWDYGDGSTSEEFQEEHSYATKGKYNVSLTVKDNNNETSVTTTEIPVGFPLASYTFSADKTEVTFTNASSSASSYLWDFGDGETSTEESPVHKYIDAGTYSVKLTAIDGSDENSVSQEIFVVAKYKPIIVNPSFESTVDVREGWDHANTNTSGSPVPPDGANGIKLSNPQSWFSQTITVDAGEDYKMYFWAVSKSVDQSCRFTITDGVDASIVLFDEIISGTPDASNYVEKMVEFNSGASTSITFKAIHIDEPSIEVRIDLFSIQ